MNKGNRRWFAVLTVLVAFICMCSCASRGAAQKRLYTFLTDNIRYTLLPPTDIEKPLDMAQYISASFQGQDYYFNAWVRADETGMEITLFNDLGAAMGELYYRDGFVQFSSPVFPSFLRPEYIIADFQLCFYNPLMLGDALARCGLVLEIDGPIRRILEGSDIVIQIEKQERMVTMHNYLRGYRYTLEGDYT